MPDEDRTDEAIRKLLRESARLFGFISVLIGAFFGLVFALLNDEQKGDFMNWQDHILAPLVVATISAIASWVYAQWHHEKKLEAAPTTYVNALDKLIQQALAAGPGRAIINARAIVAARNNMRDSLVAISASLNSQIDRLATEIGETVSRPAEASSLDGKPTRPDAERAYETIQVLGQIWPAKKEQIAVEIRKLLAELNLTGRRR